MSLSVTERKKTTGDNGDGAKTRTTLDLPQRLNASVERMAQENGTTKADILRFAVEFLTAATAAKEAGMHVGAWSEQDGKRVEREFIGL